MFSRKAALSASFIVTTVIVLVAFVIIAGTLSRFISKTEPKQAEVLCQESVALRAASMFTIGGKLIKTKVKPVPVLCKTIDKKISGTTKEEILEQLAYHITRCWWMFGEGRYEEILTGNELEGALPYIFGFESIDNDCFLCYALVIDEDFKEEISSYDILLYMNDHNHPKLKNVTYLEYLQSFGGPGRFVSLANVEGGHAYGISFVPKNKEPKSTLSAVLKIIGGIGLAATGIALTIYSGIASLKLTGGIILAGIEIVASGIKDVVNLVKHMYSDRYVSGIFLDKLSSAQDMCFKGDLAGE